MRLKISLTFFIALSLGCYFFPTQIDANNIWFPPTNNEQDEELEDLLILDVEDLVVSVASRKEEKLNNAPGIITVITAQEIAAYGANDLQDLLLRLPNTQPWSSSVFRRNVSGIRGQTFTDNDTHTLILLNGRPVRQPFNGLNNPVYAGIPLQAIKQIEIIRGPGSVLYGSNAFAGAINIVMKDPSEQNSNSVTTSYGSFDTFHASTLLSGQVGKLSVIYSGRFDDTDGWNYRASDFLGVTNEIDYGRNNHGNFLQAKYGPITFTGFTSYVKDIVSAKVLLPWPITFEINSRRDFVDFQIDLPVIQNWNIVFNTTYNGFSTKAAGVDADAHSFLFEFAIKGHITKDIYLISGLLHQADFTESIFTPTGNKLSFTDNRWSYYLQTDYQIFRFLKLIGGLQINKPRGIDADVSPRVGAILNLGKSWGVKVLYGEAFRSPTGAETNVNRPGLIGNRNINPEDIATFDAQLFYESPRFRAALTYYYSQINNIIRLTGTGPLQFNNAGRVDSNGIEFEAKLWLTRAWTFIGSISYQDNEDNLGNSDVGLISNFMAKIGVSYTSTIHGWTLGVFNSYFGDAANTGGPIFNPPAESYNWLTLQASINLKKLIKKPGIPDVTLSVYTENLLDEDVFFPPSVRTNPLINTTPIRPGISAYVGATVKF